MVRLVKSVMKTILRYGEVNLKSVNKAQFKKEKTGLEHSFSSVLNGS